MKVIISHDVDHITAWEHWKDGVLLKAIIRMFVEYAIGSIGSEEVKARIKELLKNKWNYIDELIKFDRVHGISSTFFVGVNNGKGLSYSLKKAEFYIKKIKEKGFDVGVHGICYKNFNGIKQEYDTFKKLCNCDGFGIRMHYLRVSDNTLQYLSDVGYLFDSSVYKLDKPYKINSMWEFPLHIMDSYIFEGYKGHFSKITLPEAKKRTVSILNELEQNGIKFLTLLHHDRLFSGAYISIKKWYIWVVNELSRRGYEFISYSDAIEELEK